MYSVPDPVSLPAASGLARPQWFFSLPVFSHVPHPDPNHLRTPRTPLLSFPCVPCPCIEDDAAVPQESRSIRPPVVVNPPPACLPISGESPAGLRSPSILSSFAGRCRHHARIHDPLLDAQEALHRHLPVLQKERREGNAKQPLCVAWRKSSRGLKGHAGRRFVRGAELARHRSVPDFLFNFSNNFFYLIVMLAPSSYHSSVAWIDVIALGKMVDTIWNYHLHYCWYAIMPSSTPLRCFLRFRTVRMQLGSRELQRSSLLVRWFFSESGWTSGLHEETSKEHKFRKYSKILPKIFQADIWKVDQHS